MGPCVRYLFGWNRSLNGVRFASFRPATPFVGARQANQTAIPARRTRQRLGTRTSGARAHGATRGRSPVLSDAEPQIEGGGGSERTRRPPPESRGRQINEASIERRSRPPATPRSPPGPPRGIAARRTPVSESYLVDPASSHMLVSKIKPCMCKYELIQTVKLRMAH